MTKRSTAKTQEFPVPNKRKKADFFAHPYLVAANGKKKKDIRSALCIIRALEFSTHCRMNSFEECRALVTLSPCFL